MVYILHAIVAVLDLIFKVYKHIKGDNRPSDKK